MCNDLTKKYDDDDIQYFSLTDVARMLGVSSPTIENAIRAGQLKTTKYGRFHRIYEEDIETFIKRYGQPKSNWKRKGIGKYA